MRIIIFLHIQPKILWKSYVSTIFFSQKLFFANFHVYFQCIQISEDVLDLWRHSEVQRYSFWYQWIEEVHTYTLLANIGVLGVLYRKSWEGFAITSLRWTRVKSSQCFCKKSFKSWFSEVLMHFSVLDSNTYFFDMILLFKGFYVLFLKEKYVTLS